MKTAASKNPISPPQDLISGHLRGFAQDPLGFLTDCARNYGDVVPLRMLYKRAFLLANPGDIERVFVTDHAKFRKPDWLRTPAVRRLLGDSLVTGEGEVWSRPRLASQPAFHARLMESYGHSISTLTQKMLQNWNPGETRDIQRDMTHLTLEIIAKTLFRAEGNRWVEAVGEAMDTLMGRFGSRRNLFGMIPYPPSPKELGAVDQINKAVDELIALHDLALLQERGTFTENSVDLISVLRESEAEKGPEVARLQLREHLKTFLAAGYESSSLTLSWAFLLLAQHPEAKNRLTEELTEVLNGKPPTPEDLPRLVYTRALIRETMRLYSPLWMTGRQAITSLEIDGFVIPKGALVMTSQWAMHRHPRYFPCPDEFLPERWLGEEINSLPRYAYFPFGGGPRVCIGQSFAMMELVLVLATIAQKFTLDLATDTEIKPWATMMLRPSSRIVLRLSTSP